MEIPFPLDLVHEWSNNKYFNYILSAVVIYHLNYSYGIINDIQNYEYDIFQRCSKQIVLHLKGICTSSSSAPLTANVY